MRIISHRTSKYVGSTIKILCSCALGRKVEMSGNDALIQMYMCHKVPLINDETNLNVFLSIRFGHHKHRFILFNEYLGLKPRTTYPRQTQIDNAQLSKSSAISLSTLLLFRTNYL